MQEQFGKQCMNSTSISNFTIRKHIMHTFSPADILYSHRAHMLHSIAPSVNEEDDKTAPCGTRNHSLAAFADIATIGTFLESVLAEHHAHRTVVAGIATRALRRCSCS